jgi:two-component system, NarL family, nitrate/nitrite response regulator NarL
MGLGFASGAHASSKKLNAHQPIATALICPNVLLNAGISSILSGTRFAVLPGEVPSTSDVRSPPDHGPALYIVCESETLDGYAATVETLKARCPSARIVVLADHVEPASLARALQAGLDGFCSTSMTREPLLKALELVMLGETFVSADLVFAMMGENPPDRQSKPRASAALIAANDFAAVATVNKLSEREAQILQCLTRGASNKLIARELGLAEATVKVHIKSILRKIKAANRTQAAMWASEQMNSS